MDLNSMMSNPMVGQLMQRIQSDPELMQLISQPGIMAKLQQLMANPATAQQAMQDDPELQAVVQRLMGAGGGGGGGMGDMGGMGGGMGGGGMGGYGAPNPWGTPTPSSSSSSPPSTSSSTPAYISIHSDSQYHSALTSAGSRLVVVDFTASWCGPCRRIAPAFDELAQAYRGRVVFLKVDGDENRALCQELGVSSYPTFVFLVQGVQVERFSGADERKLRATVAEYGDKEEVRVCPYKHFPLKEAEAVKYADMKWDVVEAKVDEFNGKVGEGAGRLDAMEKAELDVVIQKLQNKINYQQATFSDAQFKVAEKLMSWPVEYLGPVLNLMRLFVLHPHVAQVYSKQIVEEKRQTEDIVSTLNRVVVSAEKPVTSMLAIRVLCNFFGRRMLSKAMGGRFEDVFDAVFQAVKKHEDDNLRASAFALYINFTLLFTEDKQFYEPGKVQLLSSLPELLQLPHLSPKLVYRLLVILGSLVYEDASTTSLAVDLEIPETVEAAKKAHPADQNVQDVCRELQQALTKTS